jgi:metaxin
METQLYALYLHPSNTPLLKTLYLPASPILHLPALHALRDAAASEILKTTRSPSISPPQLLADATDALRALSTLLAGDEWFFGRPDPGLFDAEVFAYTWLILDEEFGWAAAAKAAEEEEEEEEESFALAEGLAGFDNLVSHRRRLYERCWPEAVGQAH